MPGTTKTSPHTDSGRQPSRQRRAIQSYLAAVEHHPTAEEVLAAVRAEVPTIGLATVYRNLEALVTAGEATKTMHDGRARYDSRNDPHYHFLCESCGRVDNIDASTADRRWLQNLQRRVNGVVSFVNLEIHGHCRTCRKSRKR